jgi:hypothetical protein
VVKAADPAKVRKRTSGQGREPAPPPEPANDDPRPAPRPAAERKSAVVTVRSRSRFSKAEDITVEEANRRADLANAMMQDFKRQIAEKTRPQ